MAATLAVASVTSVIQKINARHDSRASSRQEAVVQQKAARTAARAESAPESAQYTLYGKSMFKDGENVFRFGGNPVSHWVDLQIDETAGEASVLNLMDTEDLDGQYAKGIYDPESSTITIESPADTEDGDRFQTIGYSGEYPVKLVATHAFGIGYLENVDGLVMDVYDDGEKIVPRSGYTGYEYYDDYGFGSAIDVYYDVVLFRNHEGVMLQAKENSLDFGATYKGVGYERQFRVYNTGSEETDFIVYTDNELFKTDIPSGDLKPGEWKDITVLFTPDSEGDFSATVTVESDAERDVELSLTAVCMPDVDYSGIAEGELSFAMTPDYPWQMKEIDGAPVAMSDNAGIFESTSTLRALCTVADNEKAVLSWEGYYDPRFYNYDPFTVEADGIEIFRSGENGPVGGDITLGPGEHTVDFIYDKGPRVDAWNFEYGQDIVYLSSLKLVKEEIAQFKTETDRDAVDFGRHFTDSYVGDNFMDIPQSVTVSNLGWDTLEIQTINDNYPFSATCAVNSIGSQQTGTIDISLDTQEPGDYSSDVVVKTNGDDIVIHCHAVIEEMPDYSAIISSGDFNIDTYRLSPFVVDGDVAYNSNGGRLKDNNEDMSFIMFTFEVPDGETGNLRWDGTFDSDGTADYAFAMLDMDLLSIYQDRCYAGEKTFYPYQVLSMPPGEHSVLLVYCKKGDDERDITGTLTLSDISLTFDPLPEARAEIWGDKCVDFGDIDEGVASSSRIYIANTGTSALSVTGVSPSADGVFTAEVADMGEEVTSLSTAVVTVVCNPAGVSGLVSGTVVVSTTSGDVEIQCSASVTGKEDVVYIEDFENGAEGWTFFDDDENPDEQWSLITDSEAHGGSGMIGSNSWTSDWSLPCNYAASPAIEIPADKPELTYWVKANTPSDMEAYAVYVGDGDDLSTYVKLYEGEVTESGWNKKTLSLKDFAGQKKNIIFCHCAYDCNDWLYIDDVMVVRAPGSGVDASVEAQTPVKVEYFTPEGLPAGESPEAGVYVRRAMMSDGSIIVSKIIRK